MFVCLQLLTLVKMTIAQRFVFLWGILTYDNRANLFRVFVDCHNFGNLLHNLILVLNVIAFGAASHYFNNNLVVNV